MKNMFLYCLLFVCLLALGNAAEADQAAVSVDEARAMKQELRELKALVADMSAEIKQQPAPRAAAPADPAAAAPCYSDSDHRHHGYRCYPGYRNHH